MGPRTNRDILTGGKKYQQKQAKKYGVDEVVFDRESRQEYLTGFHKRKLERKKKAQEYHKEQERLAKISERKQLREERQRTFEEQLKQVKEADAFAIDSDKEEDQDEDNKKPNKELEVPAENQDDGVWTGFEEQNNEENESSDENEPIKGILLRKTVYKIDDPETLGDAIVDDETTVTVETLENPRDAFLAQTSLDAIAKANNVNLKELEKILEKLIDRAKNYAVVCGVAKPKTKKKKFRYLTKSERQANNTKARLSKMKSRNRD